MKYVPLVMVNLLTACLGVGVEPAFKDIQRAPPEITKSTVLVIVRDDRAFGEWVAETKRKCELYGCAK